jgi:hypothetical protein
VKRNKDKAMGLSWLREKKGNKMNKETKFPNQAKFIEEKGCMCPNPNCESDHVNLRSSEGEIVIADDICYVPAQCWECGATWSSEYKLNGIADLEYIEEHDPDTCGCEYRGNNMWSCGHINGEGIEA